MLLLCNGKAMQAVSNIADASIYHAWEKLKSIYCPNTYSSRSILLRNFFKSAPKGFAPDPEIWLGKFEEMRHRLAEMGENSLTDSLDMALILTNAPNQYENVVSAINMQMNTPIVMIQAPVATAGVTTLTAAQIASAALAAEASATVLASITGNEVSLKTVKTTFKDFWTAQKYRKGTKARHKKAFYAVAPATTFRTPFAGKCHNCGQVGHLSRNCTNAAVAGARQSNMRDRNSAQGLGVHTSEKCGFCGIPGHKEAVCRKKEAALAKLSGERTDGVLFVGCCSLVEKDTIDNQARFLQQAIVRDRFE
jgi:gag-polypeptide of LTR copia-type/Zinc knuckle